MAEDKKQGGEKEPGLDHMRKPYPLYEFVLGGFRKPCQHEAANHKVAGLTQEPGHV